ncbi:hypothetical protein C8J56DRAFT_711047, partial [Mycena floridula]
EASVVGWTSVMDDEGCEYLETLFIKLTHPAKDLTLVSLPPNVVPLTTSTSTIPVTFPNGNVRWISCSQVQVILNFSMTDYNSQGRTHDLNVVNLSSSKNHQAMYVALSQSSSSDGTVIMQALMPAAIKKITRGIEGDLRQ